MSLHAVNLDELNEKPELSDLLDDVRKAIVRYVVLPSAEAADAVALYVAATYAASEANTAPRLLVQSPEPRCGKSRLINDVLGNLVNRPLQATSISPAALVHTIGADNPPTIILDETDTIFTKSADDKMELLRGVLNSGFNRGSPYLRWDAQTRALDECQTFAYVVLAGINNGKMPDTIRDRSITITLRRKLPTESAERFRMRRSAPALRELGEQLRGVVTPMAGELADAEPELPDELDDRAQDLWEPLFAVADCAGGYWPAKVLHAAIVLSAGRDGEDDPTKAAGKQLLLDINEIWMPGVERMASADIRVALTKLEDSRWAEYEFGREVTAQQIAALLRPYGITPKTVRVGGRTPKGYERQQFIDAWARYVPTPESDAEEMPF